MDTSRLLTDKGETVAGMGQQGRVPRATGRMGTKNLVSQQAWAKSGGIGGVMSGKQAGPLQLRVRYGM